MSVDKQERLIAALAFVMKPEWFAELPAPANYTGQAASDAYCDYLKKLNFDDETINDIKSKVAILNEQSEFKSICDVLAGIFTDGYDTPPCTRRKDFESILAGIRQVAYAQGI
ncbi:hypothetical protein [Bryobacter aggregatus]|uniref:hypothetical protein n=1 Tax=Bryobacter aggregatus TaxID=360054 RepID=UPI0004E1A2D0|nr:hypothetical protein [Bryobacter aggregatus]